MKRTGMCSVTFRNKSAEEIVALARRSGLECIEWGGDVHVPAGDYAAAEKVRFLTESAGLKAPSYGSYFRCDDYDKFVTVSETAKILGASTVRVWAGRKDGKDFSKREFYDLTTIVKKCADYAAENGQTIAFEYHHGTYCDTAEYALGLLEAVAEENVKTYWQPMYWLDLPESERFVADIRSIETLSGKIENVHVYYWKNAKDRYELALGEAMWREYTRMLPENNYYLEFVKDDETEQLFKDAVTLSALVGKR